MLRRLMWQVHAVGERLIVDCTGADVPLVELGSGEITGAHIFATAWRTSNYTDAEAAATESKADWIAAHVNVLRFFGGAMALRVPDNPRALTRDQDLCEWIANRTHEALSLSH